MTTPLNRYSKYFSLALAAMTLCLFALTVIARAVLQDDDTRKLIDTSFLQKRPPASSHKKKTLAKYQRTSPKISDQIGQAETKTENQSGSHGDNKGENKSVNKGENQTANNPEIKAGNEVVGLTMWKLRPSLTSDDKNVRLLEREDESTMEWTPVRVDSDTVFALGDRVRLSFESPRDGYLYVVDRELYADGSMSAPFLIFPTTKDYNGNNRVMAGRVVEVPKTSFKLKAKRADYRGERLSFIVTPEPLAEISIGPRMVQLDNAQVNNWEKNWSVIAEKWELEDGKGQVYTKAEKEAGQSNARLLTQDDELPQTLFIIATKPGNPFLLSLPMKIK
ncbi:MAG: DUF4384 domain-containing protein [Acidobacteria bacterium]|nr:DUF4384 domain-containing protein [Acidobacteriota bacterium]